MITARQKYNNAVLSARQRGVDWQFTFKSWMAWWGDDFVLRGPRAQDLCMARHGDTGPYHPNNVSKKTNRENIQEMRFRVGGNNRPIGSFNHTLDSRIKMSCSRRGKPTWNKGLDKTAQAQYSTKKAEV